MVSPTGTHFPVDNLLIEDSTRAGLQDQWKVLDTDFSPSLLRYPFDNTYRFLIKRCRGHDARGSSSDDDVLQPLPWRPSCFGDRWRKAAAIGCPNYLSPDGELCPTTSGPGGT